MELRQYFNASRKELQKFGITFFIVLSLFAGFLYFKGSATWYIFFIGGVVFIVLGYIAPVILRPIYAVWMMLAFVLAWVNTRLILGIIFYILFTPMGIIFRLFEKDLLDSKVDKKTRSYWIKRPTAVIEKSRYEQMF